MPAGTAEIKSVEAPETVKRFETAEITIITNADTTKLQFTLSGGTTATYTALNAQVTENEDGTKTWTIGRIYTRPGEEELILKAKGAKDWTEKESYGTITVTR